MKLGRYYEGLELHRLEKIVYGRLLTEHRVLSTCRLNGGLREDIEYVYNHQSCEPRSHTENDLCEVAVGDPARYQKRIASKAGLPFEKCVSLGTAANMNNTAISVQQFDDLCVVAATTAGVGTNGGRAGDPASYFQSEKGAVIIGRTPPQAGTINTLLFVSEEMTPGAMLVAATVMAEAKSSVLQELMAPSRYGEGIATGTGTDQIAIACQKNTRIRHTDANKHSKLGELIGVAVRESLKEALNLQSGLTPDSRRSSVVQLQRFGESPESFAQGVKALLAPEVAPLFEANILAANHDPVTVAAVQALVHVRDQIEWGVLPVGCIQEIIIGHAALLCSAVAGREIGREAMQEQLKELSLSANGKDFIAIVRATFAVGYTLKWLGRFED